MLKTCDQSSYLKKVGSPKVLRGIALFSISTVFVLTLSGCYIQASLESLEHLQSPTIEKANFGEFVSTSYQNHQTNSRNYQINSSLGSLTKETQAQTPKGYKVFSSVQGEMISFEEVQ